MLRHLSHLENRLGYTFNNKGLLLQAITHITFRTRVDRLLCHKNNLDYSLEFDNKEVERDKANLEKERDNIMAQVKLLKQINPVELSYEWLEFLGDAVLDFVVVDFTFEKYQTADPSLFLIMYGFNSYL